MKMAERFPGFKELPKETVPPGWRVLGLDAGQDLTFYVVLAILPREDRFTLEGAWSRNRRFPTNTGLMHPKDLPGTTVRQDSPRNGDFCFRIAYLWQPRDYTWDLVPVPSWDEFLEQQEQDLEAIEHGQLPEDPPIEEALSKVDGMVDDSIDKIDRYLLPYFDEVAAQAGLPEKVSDLARRR